MEAEAKAIANGADKPAFRDMRNRLTEDPQSQERLVFEFLNLVLQNLEQARDPKLLIVRAMRWLQTFNPEECFRAYLDFSEAIIRKAFEVMASVKTFNGTHTPFYVTFTDALRILRYTDRDHFVLP